MIVVISYVFIHEEIATAIGRSQKISYVALLRKEKK